MSSQERANTGVDPEPKGKPRLLRVRVVDQTRQDSPVVNVKVPLGVAKWGMRMAQRFSPELKDADLDWEAITAMIDQGEQGKIVEVEDEAEHKTVEVWVE